MNHDYGFRTLLYHEIVPDGSLPRTGQPIDVHQRYADILPRPLFVTASAFREQMHYLHDEGVETLCLDDVRAYLRGERRLPERAVLLTFDDLYQSVREYAYPLLGELRFHAVGFAVTEWVFPQPQPAQPGISRTLSWPELDAMTDVFEYANHSATLHTREEHGTAVERAPRDLLIQDTRRAQERLHQPHVYAYPFGAYTDQTVEWLQDAGVELAFTTRPGRNTIATPPLELYRDGVLCDTEMTDFRRLVG